MKLLLCTPYLDIPGVISGGIGMWARNILNYYHTIDSDICVAPVSYDRKYNVSETSTVFSRFVFGIRDYLSSILETRKQLKNKDIDVLHLCTSAQLSLYKDLFVLRMAKRHGAKATIHFHFGRIPELIQKKNWEYRILMKVCKTADHIIVIDQKSYDSLVNVGFKNVSYLPNPLSLSIMQTVDGLKGKVTKTPNKLVFVGHVIRTKGVIELVEACKAFDGIELHVIGNGDSQVIEEMKSIASEKDNGEWLKIRGAMPHDEVLREMMSASAFVFPSYTEGFPNVILEAMACGCPIVTTTVGAIPEMLDIEHGFNYGICVEPQNTQAFADGLKQMLSDSAYASACAERAEKRVNEMYAVPVVWEQLSNIWRNA